MITPVWIIGFTGHRPKDSPGRTSADLQNVAPLIRRELVQLKKQAEERDGRAELLCGLGAGADILAAKEAEALGMPVHVILPMPESLYEKDFAAPAFAADWREAQRFIRAAQAGAGGATFRVAHGSQLRDECYYDLGAQIVYASDAIIALWDGQAAPPLTTAESDGAVSPGRGGTADVIDLAKADSMPYLKGQTPKAGYEWRGTPVRLINTVTGQVDGEISHFASIDDAGLAEIRELRHAAHHEHGPQQPLTSAQALMKFVDDGAVDWARKLRRALLWGLALHFMASLIAAVSASAQEAPELKGWVPPRLAAVELMLILLAIWCMVWAHLKHAQSRWLELRLATELIRGLASAGRLLDPLFPIATDHLPGWRRFCLSVGLTIWRDPLTATATVDGSPLHPAEQLEAEKAAYGTARIKEQFDHFGKQQPRRWYTAADQAGPFLSVLAVVFVIIALVHKISVARGGGHPEGSLFWSLVFYFLPIALPLLAGAITSLQVVTDAKRRAHVYPEMVERLRCARDFLPAIRTTASLRRFVRRTEEILLDELVGWYAAAKGISH